MEAVDTQRNSYSLRMEQPVLRRLSLILLALLVHFPTLTLAAAHAWPFEQTRSSLYTRDELWKGYDSIPERNLSFDWKNFEYFTGQSKFSPPKAELLAQRSHDAGMDHALNVFLRIGADGAPTTRKTVVIMGSHSRLRNAPEFEKVAYLAFDLTKKGYFVVTGGGPGLMEAAHVGAYMSTYGKNALAVALKILAETSISLDGTKKQYEMPDYWQKTEEVLRIYPNGAASLGIPTWFYGHEGANGFSIHVAKYFSNALREEKLCSLGFYGTIFATGGPGTAQEVFMTAAENAYASYSWYRPMIFLHKDTESDAMRSLVEKSTSKAYRDLKMIEATDSNEEAIRFLQTHLPVKK